MGLRCSEFVCLQRHLKFCSRKNDRGPGGRYGLRWVAALSPIPLCCCSAAWLHKCHTLGRVGESGWWVYPSSDGPANCAIQAPSAAHRRSFGRSCLHPVPIGGPYWRVELSHNWRSWQRDVCGGEPRASKLVSCASSLAAFFLNSLIHRFAVRQAPRQHASVIALIIAACNYYSLWGA